MDPSGSKRYGPAALASRRGVAGAGLIAAAVVVVGGAFAYTMGLLSPGRLTQGVIVDRLQEVGGLHPGFRRNHAKGLCFTGRFDSNGAVQSLSEAAVFKPGVTPVFGRFALAGGQPYQADAVHTVRSMAVDFQLPHGEVWRTGMNNIPVFPVRDARGFYDQLAASKPDPATGRPDPARMAAFLAAHPESAGAMALIKAQAPTSGFANATYNSLNAFRFVNAAGRSTPVRWSMVAEDLAESAPETGAKPTDRNYLFDDLIARVQRGPVRYHLVVTVGQPADPTDDATKPWPASRPHVDAGVLTISAVQEEDRGACRDVTFDPLILPQGIASSNDPLLSARSATYAQSFRRRGREPAPIAPVTTTSVAGGAL
jgi:catalase